MSSKSVNLTFSDSETISTTISKQLSSTIGSKLSSNTKASLAGQLEETIGAEITSQLQAARNTTTGTTATAGTSVSFAVLIPTGDLDLSINL